MKVSTKISKVFSLQGETRHEIFGRFQAPIRTYERSHGGLFWQKGRRKGARALSAPFGESLTDVIDELQDV